VHLHAVGGKSRQAAEVDVSNAHHRRRTR
jgi:hypothetical protein